MSFIKAFKRETENRKLYTDGVYEGYHLCIGDKAYWIGGNLDSACKRFENACDKFIPQNEPENIDWCELENWEREVSFSVRYKYSGGFGCNEIDKFLDYCDPYVY